MNIPVFRHPKPIRLSQLTPEMIRVVNRNADAELKDRSTANTLFYVGLLFVVMISTHYMLYYRTILLSVTAVLIFVGVARVALARAFDNFYPSRQSLWRQLFAATAYVSVICWSGFELATLGLFGPSWTSYLVIIMTVGIAAVAVISLSPELRIIRWCLYILFIPTILVTALSGDEWATGLPLIHLAFFVFLLLLAERLNAQYWNALIDNVLLRERSIELKTAKEAAETASVAKGSSSRT